MHNFFNNYNLPTQNVYWQAYLSIQFKCTSLSLHGRRKDFFQGANSEFFQAEATSIFPGGGQQW